MKGLQTRVNRDSQAVKAALSTSFESQSACPVEDEISSLLDKKAIVKVPHHRKLFYSNLFLVEKKGGGKRPVINLFTLNSFERHHHLKMEDLKVVADILGPQDVMCKIDLKDAYFAVPIHPEYQKLLCFQFKNAYP